MKNANSNMVGVGRLCAVLFAGISVLVVRAGEEWSGGNLIVYGSTDPASTYVKAMREETLNAGWFKLGTEKGSAVLVAVDSTINLSSSMYVGYEEAPGYSGLTSMLCLTNSMLTCTDFTMGYDVATQDSRSGNERIQAEIGPESVVALSRVYRLSAPWSRICFTGGRLRFDGSTSSLFAIEAHTYSGGWPSGGVTVEGVGHPIDIEISTDRKLVSGWAGRSLYLEGTGGLVKRGTGTLIWGWHTSGSNAGNFLGDATYTGDTKIEEGGIRLATPSTESKKEIRYSIPPNSPLKIAGGAFFDFAGNPAAWMSVSGDGMLTNSSTTVCNLTLGTGNADAVYSPAVVGGEFNVVKIGRGLMTLGSTSVNGDLIVSNGFVKAESGAVIRIRRLVAEKGTTIDFRGAAVTIDDLAIPPLGVNLLTDGGVSDKTLVADEDATYVAGSFAAYDSINKIGSGTVTLVGPCPKNGGAFSVAAGKVVCLPAMTFPGRYYRLDYGKSASMKTYNIRFSEFSLYGVNGGRVNQGQFAYTPIKDTPTLPYGGFDGIDDARTLAVREVAVWMPDHKQFFNYDQNHDPAKMFDGDLATYSENTWYWEGRNIIVFRLEDDVPQVFGYTFTTSDDPSCRPTEWTLDGSVDGETWVTLAVHKYGSDTDEAWDWRTNSTPQTAKTEYNGGFPYLLDSLTQTPYSVFGTAAVSVAPGATLDIVSPLGQISHLAIDLDAGAGTITHFSPAENGVIDIATTSGAVGPGMALPLAIENVDAPNALRSWKVRVNGVEKEGFHVRYANGRLNLVGCGLVLLIR